MTPAGAAGGTGGKTLAAIAGRRRRRTANANDAVNNLETEAGDNLLLEDASMLMLER